MSRQVQAGMEFLLLEEKSMFQQVGLQAEMEDKEEMLFARLAQQYGPEPAVPAGDSEPFAGSLDVNSEARTEDVSVSVNHHVLKSSSPTKT